MTTESCRTYRRRPGRAKVRRQADGSSRMVVFGDEGAPLLLGADTLEGLLLAVDPIAKRLVPTEAFLLAVNRA